MSTMEKNDISSFLGPVIPLPYIRAILLLIAASLFVASYFKEKPHPLHFTHHDGRLMKLLPGDTRYYRFTHG